jgi:hypothetical protein
MRRDRDAALGDLLGTPPPRSHHGDGDASRHPAATFADRPGRRQHASLLLAAAAVAAPAIAAAAYKRLTR